MALVFAEKYELLERIAGSDKAYNKKGSKKLVVAGKLISREMAESFNAQENNVLYVFDEEKTKELMELREKNIIAKKEASDIAKMTPAEAIAEGISKLSKPNDVELEELLEEAEELGIVIKGRKTVKSVKAKIQEFKDNQ